MDEAESRLRRLQLIHWPLCRFAQSPLFRESLFSEALLNAETLTSGTATGRDTPVP